MQKSEMLDRLPPQVEEAPLAGDCSFSSLSWEELEPFSVLEEKGEYKVK